MRQLFTTPDHCSVVTGKTQHYLLAYWHALTILDASRIAQMCIWQMTHVISHLVICLLAVLACIAVALGIYCATAINICGNENRCL